MTDDFEIKIFTLWRLLNVFGSKMNSQSKDWVEFEQ